MLLTKVPEKPSPRVTTRPVKVPVVAEGVETEKQLKLLKEAGCDLVQGYYFSRPMDFDAATKLIEDAEKTKT